MVKLLFWSKPRFLTVPNSSTMPVKRHFTAVPQKLCWRGLGGLVKREETGGGFRRNCKVSLEWRRGSETGIRLKIDSVLVVGEEEL